MGNKKHLLLSFLRIRKHSQIFWREKLLFLGGWYCLFILGDWLRWEKSHGRRGCLMVRSHPVSNTSLPVIQVLLNLKMGFPQVPCWLLTSSLVPPKCVSFWVLPAKPRESEFPARVATSAWCLFEVHHAIPSILGNGAPPNLSPRTNRSSLSLLHNTLNLKG